MEKVKPSIEQNNIFKIQLILFGNHKRALLKFSAEERWDFFLLDQSASWAAAELQFIGASASYSQIPDEMLWI